MLRVTEIKDSTACKAYFSQADYHFEGQEQTASAHGKAAEHLGISGPITQDAFARLCDGLHPETGTKLLPRYRDNRRVGYDFTFSAPKSVSLASAFGDERIAEEFRSAVNETMSEIERDMATRVRKQGRDEDRRTGNMLWADFLHTTSRPINGQPDPQLHIHAVAFNLTHDSEECQWKAGQFGQIKADAPYYQAAFRARLANRLEALGYSLRRTKDDFELSNVPERAIKEFSRRTTQIDRLAEALHITRPETKAKLGATSREKKSTGLTWEDLQSLWQARLKPGELEAIHHVGDATKMIPDHAKSVDWALLHLTERESVVRERDVVREALKHGLTTGVTPEGIWKELGRADLIRRDGLVTTKGVLAEERMILKFAVEGRGKYRPLSSRLGTFPRDPAQTAPAYAESSRSGTLDGLSPSQQAKADHLPHVRNMVHLSPSQAAAVHHIRTSPDRLMVVRGLAGTGKTTLLKTALEGINATILAPSSEASRGVLRRDGFEQADTLARFLLDDKFQAQARNSLIVLDEASLAGARDVAKLTQLADQLNSRLLLLGDRRQHKSVARGDILALLEDKAGLPVVEVAEIKRQAGEYKAAVSLLANGKTAEGFDKLTEMGWVKQTNDHQPLVNDYLSAVQAGKSVLIVSPTHAEGDAITTAIRNRLKEEGKLKDERDFQRLVPLNLTEAERSVPTNLPDGTVMQFVRSAGKRMAGDRVVVGTGNVQELSGLAGKTVPYRADSIRLGAGDLIRITANGKDLSGKHRLNNGSTYTVSGFTDAGNVRLNNGWLLPADFGHWQHGYVSTSHASQGKTTDVVLVAMSSQSLPAVTKEAAYVSVSRGRMKATIYTDSPELLREHWQRERPRMLASDLVRKPHKKLKTRLKRHISFLRDIAARTWQKVSQPTLELEYDR